MFKEKSSKKRIVTSESAKDHSTLDARHQQMIQQLQDRQKQREILEDDKIRILGELDSIADKIKLWKNNNDYESDIYQETWSSNLALKEQLQQIDQQISTISSFSDEIEYYENTGYILFQYYDLLQKQDYGCVKPVSVPQHLHGLQKVERNLLQSPGKASWMPSGVLLQRLHL